MTEQDRTREQGKEDKIFQAEGIEQTKEREKVPYLNNLKIFGLIEHILEGGDGKRNEGREISEDQLIPNILSHVKYLGTEARKTMEDL